MTARRCARGEMAKGFLILVEPGPPHRSRIPPAAAPCVIALRHAGKLQSLPHP